MTRMLVYLALAVPNGDETQWEVPGVKIPIEYAEGRKAEIRQLILYVSTDRGKTWLRHSIAQAGQSHFQFTAKKGGPHWFILVIEDQRGEVSPKDVAKADPGLKMFMRLDNKPK